MSVDPDEFPEFMARYELWEALYNLSRNLAMAGALTQARIIGLEYGLGWWPNTAGRPAPGTGGTTP